MTRTCVYCGREFEGRAGSKYCSKKCGTDASRKRCGGSDVVKLRREQDRDIDARAEARREMMRRLAERDAAYAAAFPNLATGAVRGRVAYGGRRCEESRRPITDIGNGVKVISDASRRATERSRARSE